MTFQEKVGRDESKGRNLTGAFSSGLGESRRCVWKGDGDPSAEENGARGGRASGTAVREKSDVGCVCICVCVCVVVAVL